jgi:3-(3-hydroxy-phenyl)propionate hydroxylase
VAANQDVDADVVVVGAGPVGLTLANILGLQGVRTLVVEERTTLIDYPRGVGLDDEALRAFQAIGLVDRILPMLVSAGPNATVSCSHLSTQSCCAA